MSENSIHTCVAAVSASASLNLLTNEFGYRLLRQASAIFAQTDREERLTWSSKNISPPKGMFCSIGRPAWRRSSPVDRPPTRENAECLPFPPLPQFNISVNSSLFPVSVLLFSASAFLSPRPRVPVSPRQPFSRRVSASPRPRVPVSPRQPFHPSVTATPS